MDHKALAQLGALAFLAIAVMAAAVHWVSREEAPAFPTVHVAPSEPDPLRDSQRRCQQLGEAAARDAACLKVWSDTRDRFLGREPFLGRKPASSGAAAHDTDGGQ